MRANFIFFSVLALSLVTGNRVWAADGPLQRPTAVAGFVSIFDGKSLAGWNAVPSDCSSDWTVRDGTIVGNGNTKRLAYLTWHDDQLENFELELAYRMPGKGNSGIEVRAQPDTTGKRPFVGYHADLGHVGIGPQILGAWDFHFVGRKEHACNRGTRLVIDEDGRPERTAIQDGLGAEDIRGNQWNNVRIIAMGNHFQFFINGKLSSEFTDNAKVERLDRGAIGLQIHDPGMSVEFKDIRLKKLPSQLPPARPNVLMIAVDDLNDWVGCLAGHPQARSPNIDRLAKRGTLFTNAHCQAPICNPSRTSIMYGLRPSTSGVYMNAPKPWTVAGLKDRVTLPRHFAANGYSTYTAGKIYHGSGLPDGDFDVVGPRPGQRIKLDERLVPETDGGAKGLWDFGAQTYDEKLFSDHVSASWAIEQIQAHGKPATGSATGNGAETAQPFFMAIGFYRPHVPFYSPQRVFDQIPLDGISLPLVKDNDRDDLPEIAMKVAVAAAAPDHDWFVETNHWRPAVQSYLSCIRFTDEQVGRLLDALDESPYARNTIVVLYSDHGFFLGEKQRWAKQALWERATRVPFIIVAPGMKAGEACARPTELLSIYPTLIELCGLPTRNDLEGLSLAPLLKDPQANWPQVALTTHGKDNHSVRTETHRYIRYRDGSEELYDHRTDPNEWTNLAGNPEHSELKSQLAKSFPSHNAEPANAAGNKRKQ